MKCSPALIFTPNVDERLQVEIKKEKNTRIPKAGLLSGFSGR